MAKIIYLMGPSGSGKDSIINAVRERHLSHLQIAHRYITRDWLSGGENHLQLSQAEFETRQALGFFALDWSANQHHYGIGKEIEFWLSRGQNVLVNGSRSYLPSALARYPDQLLPVLIDVAADKLAGRLAARGRETPQEIAQRIERNHQLSSQVDERCVVIENNGTIEQAVEQLIDWIEQAV